MIPRVVNRRVIILVVFIIGIYLLKILLLRTSDTFELVSKEYCNPPHRVDGNEIEKIPGYNLIQVQMLIRHGDRAPVDPYALPNADPVVLNCLFNHSNSNYKDILRIYKHVIGKEHFEVKGSSHPQLMEERNLCKPGQLTPYGILQHYYIGRHLSKSYETFLQNVNVENDIHVIATDVPRTMQSSAALLTGVFSDRLSIRNSPAKIPINVHKDHLDDAHLLLDEKENDLSCLMLRIETKKFLESDLQRDFKHNIKPMLTSLASYLSVDVDKLPEFNRIVDIFFTRLCHRLGVPRGPDYKIPRSLLKQFFGFSHHYHTIKHASPLAELQALSLLSQVAKHSMIALRHEKGLKKLVIYSGHDSMIQPFLHLIDTSFTQWPPYAARIVFEIYVAKGTENDDPDIINKSFYRIIYNGKPLYNIKFCDSPIEPYNLCSVAQLYKHVSNGFYKFSQYKTDSLSHLLFSKINALCTEEAQMQ